jgi:hypothetical protein
MGLGLFALLIGLLALALPAARMPWLAPPLIVGYLLRAGTAFVQAHIMLLPHGRSDALVFERAAWRAAQQGWPAVQNLLTIDSSSLYAGIIGLVYLVVGHRSPLLIGAINVALGTWLIYLVYRIAETIWFRQAALIAAWITALFPTLILLSAVTLREMMIAVPFTWAALGLVRWRATNNQLYLIQCVVGFFASIAFHGGMLLAVAMLVVLLGLKAAREVAGSLAGGVVRKGSVGLLLGAVIGVASVLALGQVGVSKIGALDADELAGQVVARSERGPMGAAGYLHGWQINSPMDIAIQAPIRMIYFVFSPLPWNVGGAHHLTGFIDAWMYVALLIVLWRTRKDIRRNEPAHILWLLSFAMIFVFAIGTSNFGTGIRHRAKVVPLLIALSAAGIAWWLARRRAAPRRRFERAPARRRTASSRTHLQGARLRHATPDHHRRQRPLARRQPR